MEAKEWCGDAVCDFCQKDVSSSKFVDGKTRYGMWALMCYEKCFREHGSRIGWGLGQLYDHKFLVKGGSDDEVHS
jgi:hypothetical protein